MNNFLTSLFVLFICSTLINAQTNTNTTKKSTELELLLFNMGFTSLMMDFEISKKQNKMRDKKITKLKKDIDNLYKRDAIFKKQQEEIKKLKFSNKALTQEVKVLNQLLKQTIDRVVLLELSSDSQKLMSASSQSNSSSFNVRFDRYEIVTETIPIRDAPRLDAKILEYKNSGSILEIEFCTIVGWCKLHNSWSYVLKEDLRLILPVEKNF